MESTNELIIRADNTSMADEVFRLLLGSQRLKPWILLHVAFFRSGRVSRPRSNEVFVVVFHDAFRLEVSGIKVEMTLDLPSDETGKR